MPTLKYSIGYYFKSMIEVAKERLHRASYMRKLRFTISTADKLYKETKRKYYVVHDVKGEPTIITARMVNTFKAQGRIPKEWTHVDLENQSLYIPFQLKPEDATIVIGKDRKKKTKTAYHPAQASAGSSA